MTTPVVLTHPGGRGSSRGKQKPHDFKNSANRNPPRIFTDRQVKIQILRYTNFMGCRLTTATTRFVAQCFEHADSPNRYASVRVAVAVGLAFADFEPFLEHIYCGGSRYPVVSLGVGWRTSRERLEACVDLVNAIAARVPGPVEVVVDGQVFRAGSPS